MIDARPYLLATLQHVIDGGDLTAEELDTAIPDPSVLDKIEKDAWEELSHWADDGDIRAKDDNYAAIKRDWMRECIAALDGYNQDEIERGEHHPWHVPVWGCVATIVAVLGLAYLLLR